MKEVLKLALEALENALNKPMWDRPKMTKTITAIKEALAQDEKGLFIDLIAQHEGLAEELAQPEQCQCPNCRVTLHASDCAVHNEPAYPKRACNCGAQPEQEPTVPATAYDRLFALNEANAARIIELEAAQQEQEPVAWRLSNEAFDYQITSYDKEQANTYIKNGWHLIDVLYTSPPKRPWVELTDEKIQTIHDTYYRSMGPQEFARAIDAKLKELNT